jgi:hypothetical protein
VAESTFYDDRYCRVEAVAPGGVSGRHRFYDTQRRTYYRFLCRGCGSCVAVLARRARVREGLAFVCGLCRSTENGGSGSASVCAVCMRKMEHFSLR